MHLPVYQFPQNHYYVSEKAQKLWDAISSDSIFNYTYRDTVIKDVDGEVVIEKFRGGEGKPYATSKIKRGDSFVFKDVFTDEHIVTVSNIIDFEVFDALDEPEILSTNIGVNDSLYYLAIDGILRRYDFEEIESKLSYESLKKLWDFAKETVINIMKNISIFITKAKY